LLVLAGCRAQPAPPTATPSPTSTPIVLPTSPPKSPTPSPTASPTLRPSSTPFPTNTPAPSLTPIPTNTPTPGVLGLGSTDLPFRDDFSDPLSGWAEASGDDFGFGYTDSASYEMYSNIPIADVTVARSRFHTDVAIEVVVTKVEGPDSAFFGVNCRKVGDGNYFTLAITGNGGYEFYRSVGSKRELLLSGTSGAIKKGNTTNRLKANCVGQTLSLEVNGVNVGSITSEYFAFGELLGLIVGTHSETGIRVIFDNFNAYEP